MRGLGWLTLLALVACATGGANPPPAAPGADTAAPGAGDPSGDRDRDGIADRADKCPGDAETPNGYQDEDGCPDLSPQSFVTSGDITKIVERIGFEYDSASIRPGSFAILDAIAVVLKMQPRQFPLVALEGHAADNEHAPMKLSLARASAVRIALLARGLDVSRLLARASGTTAPACSEQNEGCWARERTVEFVTLGAPKSVAASEPEPAGPAAAPPDPNPSADNPVASIPLERVEFKKGSAVLPPPSLANLDVLAGFMKATPSALEIVGYADDNERTPDTLAAARADAVRRYMIACGVAPQHLTTRTERTGRAACRTHSANCPARDGRAELRFVEAPPAPSPTDRQ